MTGDDPTTDVDPDTGGRGAEEVLVRVLLVEDEAWLLDADGTEVGVMSRESFDRCAIAASTGETRATHSRRPPMSDPVELIARARAAVDGVTDGPWTAVDGAVEAESQLVAIGNHCTVMSVSAQADLVTLFRRLADALEDTDAD